MPVSTAVGFIDPDQRYLMFLAASASSSAARNAAAPATEPLRYSALSITWGFDSSAAGMLRIVSGKTARVATGPSYEDMGPYLSKDVAEVVAEIRKALAPKPN